MPQRVLGLVRSPAAGAAVAQIWQALGSFVLQILAAWTLGAAGLGVVSLSLGVIVLTTALASGVVGDSLVILDRHDRVVRGGLEGWAVLLCLAGAGLAGAAMAVLGLLDPAAVLLFALALGAFQIEELVRRNLMATMRFWRLVVLDSTALVVALSTLGVWSLVAPMSLAAFFLALLAGQIAGIAIGLFLLPRSELKLVPITRAGLAKVAGFGLMRGIQVSVTPGLLTASRTLILLAAGQAALGEVEAARIFVAPALLVVQGLGSYLLASYARDREEGAVLLVSRARRSSLLLIGAAVVAGGGLTLLSPVLAHLVTGPSFSVDQLAVAGWALYVAGSASVQPFASLGAVLGRQPIVLACRGVDAALALGLVWVLIGPASLTPSFTPFALAAGLFIGGLLVRRFALRPLVNQASAGSADDAKPTRTDHAYT